MWMYMIFYFTLGLHWDSPNFVCVCVFPLYLEISFFFDQGI